MTRTAPSRLAACLATGLVAAVLAWVPGGAESAAAAEDEQTPLEVSIGSLSPSTVPRRGDVTITGRITNRSDSTWTDLNVYLLTSPEPMTTSEELQDASRTDPASEVGARITAQGLYDEIGDLEPGESTPYLLSVPRGELRISGEVGVYWLGVHVLGAADGTRDSVADGRARSFLPLMRARGPRATLSLVVPVKAEVRRRADGSLFNLGRWQRDLDPDGRLGRLLDLVGTSVDTPFTLLMDPAVVDAAQSVASDNPTLDIGPTDDSEDPSGASSPTPEEDATPPGPSDGDGEEPAEPSPEATRAARWLKTLVSVTAEPSEHTVLTVPYGDVDVASMLRNNYDELYERAVELSTETMESFGMESAHVVAPPRGRFPSPLLDALEPDTTLILSDRAAPEAETSVIETEHGHDAVLLSSSASAGGPSPTPRFEPLAIRQRILSEAAVHALTGPAQQPIFASTPPGWDPGEGWRSADFFGGLDVPWLRTVDLAAASAVSGALSGPDGEYDARLSYPRARRRAELPTSNLLATDELRATGGALAALLTRNDRVDDELSRTAMLASSSYARRRPHRYAVATRRVSAHVRSLMAKVSIDAPTFVTMSSDEGPVLVTVVNDLEEPVTVGIQPNTAGDGLVIDPPPPVSLGPGQRASVRLKARSKSIGVYSVILVPTTSEGHELGGSTKFSIRSSQVGLVIWVIMGIGGAILLAAVVVRISRRVRARRSVPVPEPESESEPQ